VWKVTTPGTSAASAPTWVVCNSGNVGTTVTDSNGVVYTCQGTGNGRGDVFVVQLSGATLATPPAPAIDFVKLDPFRDSYWIEQAEQLQAHAEGRR
jgi:hypothetical protein